MDSISRVQGFKASSSERRLFAWLSLVILCMVVIGFARTYLLVPTLGRPEGSLPFSLLIHVHATVFFSWCLLFLVQSWLVALSRIPLHREIGMAGVLLYVGLIVTGPLVAIRSVVRYGNSAEELSFLAVGLGNVVAYGAIIGAGLLYRGRPDIHKRLMVLGMVPLLSAPFGRLGEYPYLLQHVFGPSLVVIALALIDRASHGRVHPVTKIVGPAALIWQLVPNLYMNTDFWRSIASAIVRFAV